MSHEHGVQTRLTRNGVHMAFVALFAALGGSVRGFNLLVILAGLIIGILLMQWRFSRVLLPGLSARRMLPREAFAKTPFKVRFAVANGRWWLPAWLIRIEDKILAIDSALPPAQAGCSLSMIRPSSSEATQYDCTFSRRGHYQFGPLRLTTGFPFGLTRAAKNAAAVAPLTVFPRLATLRPQWIGVIENRRDGLSASRHSSGPSEGDFYGIRRWQTGDSRRWIHWRTTARIGNLAVRQFEHLNRTELSLLVDPYSLDDADSNAVEWAISVAAAMVQHLAVQNHPHLVLGIADAAKTVVASNRVPSFRTAALHALAGVRCLEQPPLDTTLAAMFASINPHQPIVVVSPRPARMDLLRSGQGPGGARFSPLLFDKLDILWLDVTSPSSERIAYRREEMHGQA